MFKMSFVCADVLPPSIDAAYVVVDMAALKSKEQRMPKKTSVICPVIAP